MYCTNCTLFTIIYYTISTTTTNSTTSSTTSSNSTTNSSSSYTTFSTNYFSTSNWNQSKLNILFFNYYIFYFIHNLLINLIHLYIYLLIWILGSCHSWRKSIWNYSSWRTIYCRHCKKLLYWTSCKFRLYNWKSINWTKYWCLCYTCWYLFTKYNCWI